MDLVTLTISLDGTLAQEGFRVVLSNPTSGLDQRGHLPPAPALAQTLQDWRVAYRALPATVRIKPKEILYKGQSQLTQTCSQIAERLRLQFVQWLNHPDFLAIDRSIRELLHPDSPLKILLRADDWLIHRLPWHYWDVVDRQPQVAIAFGRLERQPSPMTASTLRPQIRVLAIFGDATGLDLAVDQTILNTLPQAQVTVLSEPTRSQMTTTLWDESWDILCFSGHSQTAEDTGYFGLSEELQLTLEELRYALRRAINQGLKLAIFNSCDGLGLAKSLLDFNLPYFVVMREPLPDAIAHHFLSVFLKQFSQGVSLSQSLRHAQERLQGQEQDYPCASWLPIFFDNSAIAEPTWHSFLLPAIVTSKDRRSVWSRNLIIGLIGSTMTLAVRWMGGFENLELKAYDQLMQWMPAERRDDRLLLITVDDEDIRYQEKQGMKLTGSLSPVALQKLIQELQSLNPVSIGLDVYRSAPLNLPNSPLVFPICKVPAPEGGDPYGVDPPPDIPSSFVGFSDFLVDQDDILRRQLLALKNEATQSSCTAQNSLNFLLAVHYLQTQGYQYQLNEQNELDWGLTHWPRLTSSAGGYHNLDAGGYQVLLQYRKTQNLKEVAQTIPLRKFLQGAIPEVIQSKLQNRIVLIGITASSSSDRWQTPLTSQPKDKSTGLYLQAQMVSQLISSVIDGRSLTTWWPDWLESLWILCVVTVSSSLIFLKRSIWLRLILTLMLILGAGIVAFLWMLNGVWIPLVPVLLGLVLMFPMALGYEKLQKDGLK